MQEVQVLKQLVEWCEYECEVLYKVLEENNNFSWQVEEKFNYKMEFSKEICEVYLVVLCEWLCEKELYVVEVCRNKEQ